MKLAALIPFIFLSIFVISVLSSPALAYYDLNVSDDSYVREDYANSNYAYDTSFGVQGLVNYLNRAYVAVDLSSIPVGQTVINATLFLKNNGGAFPSNPLTYPQHNNTSILAYNTTYFNETNITWNNMPSEDTFQDNVSNAGYYYAWQPFDITEAVKTAYDNSQSVYIELKYANETYTDQINWIWKSKQYVNENPYLRVYTADETGCSGYDNGAWCNEYDLRRPCCYSETIGDYLFMEPPQCTFDTSNCYDLYGEVPNMMEDLGTDFTVYNSSVDGCIQEYSACPSGYLCSQFYNSETHLFEGKVSCYGTSTGEWVYYNESGDAFNGTEYIESYSTCDTFNAWIYNNSWSCRINGCQWCPLALTCIGTEGDCSSLITSSNCTNSSTVCYNQYCNIVSCTTNNIQTWAQSFNRGTGVPIASEILAFVLALGFGMFIFLKTKSKTLETFLVPFLSIVTIFCLPGIEFIPVWVLLLEAMMIFVLVFFKVKG